MMEFLSGTHEDLVQGIASFDYYRQMEQQALEQPQVTTGIDPKPSTDRLNQSFALSGLFYKEAQNPITELNRPASKRSTPGESLGNRVSISRTAASSASKAKTESQLFITDSLALDKVLMQLHISPAVKSSIKNIQNEQGYVPVKDLVILLDRAVRDETISSADASAPAPEVSALLASINYPGKGKNSDYQPSRMPLADSYDLNSLRQLLKKVVLESTTKRFKENAALTARSSKPQPAGISPTTSLVESTKGNFTGYTESLNDLLLPGFCSDDQSASTKQDGDRSYISASKTEVATETSGINRSVLDKGSVESENKRKNEAPNQPTPTEDKTAARREVLSKEAVGGWDKAGTRPLTPSFQPENAPSRQVPASQEEQSSNASLKVNLESTSIQNENLEFVPNQSTGLTKPTIPVEYNGEVIIRSIKLQSQSATDEPTSRMISANVSDTGQSLLDEGIKPSQEPAGTRSQKNYTNQDEIFSSRETPNRSSEHTTRAGGISGHYQVLENRVAELEREPETTAAGLKSEGSKQASEFNKLSNGKLASDFEGTSLLLRQSPPIETRRTELFQSTDDEPTHPKTSGNSSNASRSTVADEIKPTQKPVANSQRIPQTWDIKKFGHVDSDLKAGGPAPKSSVSIETKITDTSSPTSRADEFVTTERPGPSEEHAAAASGSQKPKPTGTLQTSSENTDPADPLGSHPAIKLPSFTQPRQNLVETLTDPNHLEEPFDNPEDQGQEGMVSETTRHQGADQKSSKSESARISMSQTGGSLDSQQQHTQTTSNTGHNSGQQQSAQQHLASSWKISSKESELFQQSGFVSNQQTLSLENQRWPVSLAEHIGQLHRQKRNELTLELAPEKLGHILVRLDTEDNQVKAFISTESEHARELLYKGSSSLRQELNAQGLVLSQLSIDVRDGKSNQRQPYQRRRTGNVKAVSSHRSATVLDASIPSVENKNVSGSSIRSISLFI